MDTLELFSGIVFLAGFLSFLNHRLLKLPPTIGLLVLSLGAAILALILSSIGVLSGLPYWIGKGLLTIDFQRTVMRGFLSILLFAGALQIPMGHLREEWKPIAALSTLGVLATTVLFAAGLYSILSLLGIAFPFSACLLLGALISPTDPVAVLAMLQGSPIRSGLRTLIAGESLFNDGVGVIVFTVVLEWVSMGANPSVSHILTTFAHEVIGGIAAGFVLGLIMKLMLWRTKDADVAILMTLGVVLAGYAVCYRLDTSGPLAMVVAGILVGNHGRTTELSSATGNALDKFYASLDWILNAMLFVLLGLEIITVPFTAISLISAAVSIALLLGVRWIVVETIGRIGGSLRQRKDRSIVVWSGVKGGLSIALVLALPASDTHLAILVITYSIVLFSVIVQGLVFERLTKRLLPNKKSPARS